MAKKIVRPVWMPKFIFKAGIGVWNIVADIRLRHWAKKNHIHDGTVPILLGGAWADKEGNIYNCVGKNVGKIEWAKGYGITKRES